MGNTLTRNFLEFYFRDEESFYLCIKAKSNKLEVKMKEDLKYKGVDFSDIESDREFYGCTFEECSFAQAKLTNVLFSRCEFIRCDFSLCKIYGVSFQDVRFVGCKMLGGDFTGCKGLLSLFDFEKCL